MQYQLQNLNYNTNYEWYIIVSDGQSETRSEAWSFRTIQNPEENHAPNVPSNPYPAHNSINIPIELTLTWLGGDPNNDVVRYDVYLNNRLVCDNTILTSCRVENLRYNTIYSWYVIASDGQLTSQGQLWGFTTQAIIENQAPTINIRAPEENGIISGVYNIRWNANDVDGEIINTKIYYKPYSRIPLVKYLFNWLYEYELLADLNDNPGNYFWDTTRLRNRIYSLKIVVADDDNANGEDVVNRFRIFNREIQNHAPIIISEPVTNIKVNNQYIYDVNAVDADGDEITYSLRNAPRGMRINPNTGFISWLPDTIGIYTDITVTATDEHGAFDPQTFTIKVLSKDIVVAPKKEPRDIHEFSLSNVILYQDNYYIDVYVQVMNKGNQNEKIVLKAINMNTGDFMFDSFLLENKDNYWRILKLHKPKKGIYTIGVFGNSKDYKDIVYREIVIR
jgi:hypothetical protein